jgi:predicted dehydrogenase
MTFVEDPRSAPPLRWGILGPGKIAHRFARELLAHSAQLVTAVGSRNQARGTAFAEDYGIEAAYGDYASLLADPDVDVVYIATPHSEPVARSESEARAIFAAARSAGLFAMEAMWSRFLPHMIELKAAVDRGELGEVIALWADHGQMLNFGPTHRLLNPDLAGGALLDLGVYPISFAHLMLGYPDAVTAVGQLTQTGVDGHASVVLSYGGWTQAVVDTTLWAPTPCTAWIAGEAGRVELDRTFYMPTQFRLTRLDGTSWRYDGRVPGGFQYQIAEAARCIADGAQQSELRSWQDTIEVMRIMDDVRAQIGVTYPGEAD